MTTRRHIHLPRSLGERTADAVAARVGSWPFIIGQSFLLALWIAANVYWHLWDQYPFILLNLCLSFQAAYTGPIVMMSQNRTAQKDRVRDDHEAVTVDESHATLTEVYGLSNQIHRLMLAQDEVLAHQHEILRALSGESNERRDDGGDPGAPTDTGPATQTVVMGTLAEPSLEEWTISQGGER